MPASLKRRARGSSVFSCSSDKIIDLQPLRDLALNFDIDIEPYLNEYLNEYDKVEKEEGEEESGAQNFTTAALKIQNSVGIYNRKVDFLHAEAYKVHNDFLLLQSNNSKHNNKKRQSSTNTKGDQSTDAFYEYDAEREFLLLDEVLPTDEGRRKINLKANEQQQQNDKDKGANANLDQTVSTSAGINCRRSDGGNNDSGTPEVTLLSLGGVAISGTRMTEQDGSTFFVGRQSLDRANPSTMSKILMANLQGGNGGDHCCCLRLLAGMCDVASNGALLMPGTKASVLVNRETSGSLIFPGGLLSPPPENKDKNDDANNFGAQTDNHVSFGNNDIDWAGDDNDGDGFQLNDPTENQDLGEKELKDATSPKSSENQQPAVMKDPWATLDPHEPSNDAKPLRIDVTIRLPPEFDDDDRPSASVTGSSTRVKKKKGSKKKKQDPLDSATAIVKDLFNPPFLVARENSSDEEDLNDHLSGESHTSLQQRRKNKRDYLRPLNQLKQKELIFGKEFEYIFKAHSKYRDAFYKQQRDRQEQETDPAKLKGTQDTEYKEQDDYGGGFDFVGGGDDDSFGHPDNIENPKEEIKQSFYHSNVDFNEIGDVFGGGDSVGVFDENDNFTNTAHCKTFEELCHDHLRKFAKSAENQIGFETDLSKLVAAWQAGLLPLLEEQEKRPAFDIHEYGREILSGLERKLPTVRKRKFTGEKKLEMVPPMAATEGVVFSKILPEDDCENYKVCRLFLSMLMLCNSGNVSIYTNNDDDTGGVESLESLNIKLLDPIFKPPVEPFTSSASLSLQHNGCALASSNPGIFEEHDRNA